MKHTLVLSVASLLMITLLIFHLSDEIARGLEPGRISMVNAVLVVAGWLYGALVLVERRSGHIIVLLGSILGFGVSVLHMMGGGLAGGRIANTSGIFFWAWTLLTLSVTAAFTFALSAHGLWRLRGPPR
jgi:NO-binding membrane sensor protein with MHYT domain